MFRIYSTLACLLLVLFLGFPRVSDAAFSVAGSNIATGSAAVAMPITDLQITGSGTEPIPVKLLVTSGTLAMSTVAGLTFTGGQTGATLFFSGTQANINAALATLTYTRGGTGNDTLEVSLVEPGEVFFPDNNHLYKFITGSITANNARTAAELQTAYGATGYLATITSQAENDFVAERLQGDGWMGASDVSSEGVWRWIAGPESGTQFWSGAVGGSAVGGNYENWADGEPNDYNNGSPGEDCAQFYISTGMWNDLPCSGSNLTGYVVEFGASGNMPNVAAKNITINTVQNPTVSSFTPADGATGVTLNANLVIGFSKVVLKGTGNIVIRRTSDDGVVETIDVTSSQVSGNNSSTITIDPSVTLGEDTGYYVTIPGTAFRDSGNNYFAGVTLSSTWNFTTGDFTNPIISNISVSYPSTTSASIVWTTNENASSRVIYGLSDLYGSQTSETDTSPRVASHTVTLSSLVPCTTYHYQVVSRDAGTNSGTSSDQIFTTTGCESSVTPTSTESNTITSAAGGTTTLEESDTQIAVETPANFTDDSSSVVIQIKSLPNEAVLESLGRPANVPNEVGNIVFDVKAIINSTTVLDSFDAPVTITYTYTDADTQGLDESSFWLYNFHNGSWRPLDSCTINTGTNTISCTTQSFSIFGLFGRQQTSTSSSNNGGGYCSAISEGDRPDLFQIDVSNNQARLYFAPVAKNVNRYFISYGYKGGEERFGAYTGVVDPKGVVSYTINNLDPNMEYFFRVRPHNDCSFGKWSNEMKVTTVKSTGGKKYYKNFLAQVFSIFPQQVTNGGAAKVMGSKVASKTVSKTSCEYIVTGGDSLWAIAFSKLNDGTKYHEIMKLNNLTTTSLSVGKKLKIC